MKNYYLSFVSLILVAIATLFVITNTIAGKLYMWTDETGLQHISDTPPPANTQEIESLHYKEKTPEEEATEKAAREQRETYETHLIEQQNSTKEANKIIRESYMRKGEEINRNKERINPEKINGEEYRLKRKIELFEIRSRTANMSAFREMNINAANEVRKDLDLLRRSPEIYFQYKSQKMPFGSNASGGTKMGINLNTGEIVPVVPIK